MNVHKNARPTPIGRELLIERLVRGEQGLTRKIGSVFEKIG